MEDQDHPIEAAPQRLARIGGLLYLIIIGLGIFGEAFVRGRILVADDAMATAANLRAHELLWRWGIAAELLSLICVVALLLIWVVLLRPVSRDLTLLAVFFDLVSHTVQAVSSVDLVATLFPLDKAGYLRAFTPEQLAVLAKLAVRTHAHGFGVSLLFSGCFFLVAGYLIFKSGYLPKLIGVLYQIAGLGYLTHTFVLVLAPSLADRVFLAIMGPIFIGESSLCLWLLFKGVNVEKWNRRQVLGARGAQSAAASGSAVG
jgi:hypothetical protein